MSGLLVQVVSSATFLKNGCLIFDLLIAIKFMLTCDHGVLLSQECESIKPKKRLEESTWGGGGGGGLGVDCCMKKTRDACCTA